MALRSCSRCGSAHPAGERCPLAPSGRAAGSPSTRAQRDGTGDYERERARVLAGDPACVYCGRRGTPENPMTAEHPVAVADGGGHAGMVPACRRCNLSRGARLGNERRRQR
jgi:5-methylcytosine-specific restriction endonuclease McrA